MKQALQQDIEYVDIRPSPDRHHEPTSFYERWIDQSSAKHANPELIGADALRKMYPGYSLVVSDDYRLNLLGFPGVRIHSTNPDEAEPEQVTNVIFTPTPKRIGGEVAGSLVDNIILGSYRLTWNTSDFVVHITKFQNGNYVKTVHFILHDGPEQPARDLVLAACLYAERTHDEIWVFNQGYWSKNKSLWLDIKDSSWDDVVMKEDSKKALQKDVYGFFKSEATYRKLSIPWKRGLIMYGPPGNGKTISIKVIMKTCTERGFTPLYVKSFQGFQGEEASMQSVFQKTRQLAPCVLILEDLDSLINDRNRSFFLNQLDGIEGNDGLLVIASTNHYDRLDPGLSNRPSRFDRKYLFDDPDRQERVLYAKYWQEKLRDNEEICFPESLVEEVADLTQGFSFAYLKEAFVSSLVRITNADDDEQAEFTDVLKSQIKILRKELVKQIIAPRACTLSRAPPGSRQSIASLEDRFTERSRAPRQLPLPTNINVSPTELDTSDNAFPLPTAQTFGKRSDNPTRSQTSEKVYTMASTVPSGRPFPQGCVLHAPPSVYPQVMPGSLPSSGLPDPLQDSFYPTWRGAQARPSSITGGVDISRRNPFSMIPSPPLIEMYDDVRAGESSASTGRDA